MRRPTRFVRAIHPEMEVVAKNFPIPHSYSAFGNQDR
jgi:hypothetical protein